MTRRTLTSCEFCGPDPAWKNQVSLIGQSLSGGMNRRRLAYGGMCSLSPCSAEEPRAAAYWLENQ